MNRICIPQTPDPKLQLRFFELKDVKETRTSLMDNKGIVTFYEETDDPPNFSRRKDAV